ncbi:MAG: sugar ABC transporter permease [Bacteroidetes bacterium]|nr:sugar ABC transporter permease [Bacteroidota bacterium]
MKPGISLTNDPKRLAYLYIFPALLVMALVIVGPFLYNLVVSFSNMNLMNFRDWKLTGIDNYLEVFTDRYFWYFFFKTILWTVLNVTVHVAFGIFLAILMNQYLVGKNIFRILIILPWAVPQYITALTWRGMFNYEYGAINLILETLGMGPVQWLGSEWGAFFAALMTNIWLGIPFMMIVALGGLQSIPNDLYEAAEIDGASKWFQFWNITLPLLRPVMVPAITLGVIWTFNNFNVVWLVSDGGKPSDSTHILVSWVYKVGLNYFRIGYAAAFSMVIFGLLLIFGWNYIKRTRGTESVYE